MTFRTLKQSISQSLPERFRKWLWRVSDSDYRYRYREVQQRIRRIQAAQREAGKRILSNYDSSVLSGPFQGVSYFDGSRRTILALKILGTYEKELWPVVEEIVNRDYRTIIDIGAAEGYYVVGLAKRLPEARIVAFEAQTDLHPRIWQLAERNGVEDRIEVHGLCNSPSLNEQLNEGEKTLVICDIEGAEQHVLNPVEVPALNHIDMLVEVHDHLAPGISAVLNQRFGSTHKITNIPSVPRNEDDFPIELDLDVSLKLAAMDESRDPAGHWFWLDCVR